MICHHPLFLMIPKKRGRNEGEARERHIYLSEKRVFIFTRSDIHTTEYQQQQIMLKYSLNTSQLRPGMKKDSANIIALKHTFSFN